ncbi:MAG: substrate-binding domain-containing protein, partial [Anaerolineae bacterium]
RRIAHVRHAHDYETAQLRLNSYKDTLNQHGIPVDDRYIVAGDERFTGGVRAVDQLLALPEPPTAVFCFNDMTAVGVINALLKKGINVPKDVSVVGFDGLDIASFYYPALTTVHQPTYQIGRESAKMLSGLIEGKNNIKAQIIEPQLIVRESTAPPRAE